MNSKYLFFANCIPVRGICRSIICDLQRNSYVLIPNSLIDLLDNNCLIDTGKWSERLDSSDLEVLEEYTNYLTELEFIYPITDNEETQYPPLSNEWDFPSTITNIIVDVGLNSDHNYQQIMSDTDKLNCRYLQLRCFYSPEMSFWENIITMVNKSSIKTIDIVMQYSSTTINHLREWVSKNKKIKSITLSGGMEDAIISKGASGFGVILVTREKIISDNHCGVIHPTYFSINVLHYNESLKHNTCLNRKISVDVEGNIKNCPSMSESFGSISDTTLIDAVEKAGFKKYWDITKDDIRKCKDCEFRRICTDCRAYLSDPDDIYSDPIKCGYDPNTCTWEDWSTNPLKQSAIDKYGLREMI
jgi:SPASM domain peptide maturase of grasp-with-spasm system